MNYILVIGIMGRRIAKLLKTKKAAKEYLSSFGSAVDWTLYDDELHICDSSGVHLDYRNAALN